MDSRAVAALASRPAVAAEFPSLTRTKLAGCCGQKKQVPDMPAVAVSVAEMTAEAKAKLKALLGATEVVVYLPTGGTVRF